MALNGLGTHHVSVLWQAKVTKTKTPLYVPERSGRLSLIMAAGARTCISEKKKKRDLWHKMEEARIAKKTRWLEDFGIRYSQFLLETRILSRPYVRRSHHLFSCRVARFHREYELTTAVGRTATTVSRLNTAYGVTTSSRHHAAFSSRAAVFE